MSRSMRPRAIDFDKPMPVVQSQGELEMDPDEQVLRHKKEARDVDLFEQESNIEAMMFLEQQADWDKSEKKANIPVPPIVIIEDYDKSVSKDYVRPASYLRYKQLTEKELDEILEYEMDESDMTFVNQTLPALKIQIKEDKFEQIVDRLEKESFKLGKMCEQVVLETHKLGGKVGAAVYEYWRKKREKLGKPLVRRFQPPTSIQDTSPHSTFRPREKEEKRIRRTRKNDKDAHKKLKNLQDDFRRAKVLLEHVVRREKMKKVLLELDFCLQFAKDMTDIPKNILIQHDAFFKEMREKQRQSKLAQEGLDGQLGGVSRPRPAARPAVLAGLEDEALFKAEEQAPEKLEGIKRCFQHLMMKWDEDGDDAGTSLLPITHDAKLVQYGAASSGESLRFRGRARIGRGGRVLFDRCSYRVANLHAGDAGGAKRGFKRSRDGRDVGGDVGAILDDMRQAVKKVKVCGATGAWDFQQLHSKVSAGGKVLGRAVAAAGRGRVGVAGVTALVDVKKASLGQLSALWGSANVDKMQVLVAGINMANGMRAAQVKKGKPEGEDTAASTASTALGSAD